MARNGVWQLQRLTVTYCDWGGSSRGAREFIQAVLPKFQEQNPQLVVEQTLRRGGHPFLKAEYLTKNQRIVDVKNKNAEEILEHSIWLRSSAGRRTSKTLKKRQISKQPSIQGGWTPATDAAQQLQWVNQPVAGKMHTLASHTAVAAQQ